MKKLFSYVFLILLSISVSTYADDITDLEIEGISIGESLLLYLKKENIKKEIEINKSSYSYLDDKFGEVYMFSNELIIYDYLSFFVKPSDNKYIIHSIYGSIAYNKDIKNCFKKQKEITKIFSSTYPNAKKSENEITHNVDPTGRSKIYYVYFKFKNGDLIKIECTEFEKSIKLKNNWDNGLSIGLSKKSVDDWLSS